MKTLRSFCLLAALSFAAVLPAFALSVADITDVTPKVDENPVPVKTPPPTYPADLKKDGVTGIVAVVVVVDEQGDVIASEVKKASNEKFSEPALAAIQKWKFKPAKVAGKAVKVKVTIPVHFNLDE